MEKLEHLRQIAELPYKQHYIVNADGSFFEAPDGKRCDLEANQCELGRLDAKAILALHASLSAKNQDVYAAMDVSLMKALMCEAIKDGMISVS